MKKTVKNFFILAVIFFAFCSWVKIGIGKIDNKSLSTEKSENFLLEKTSYGSRLTNSIADQFSKSSSLLLKQRLYLKNCSETVFKKGDYDGGLDICYRDFEKINKSDYKYFYDEAYILGVVEIFSGKEDVIKRGLERLAKICLFNNRVNGKTRSYALLRLSEAVLFLPEDYFKEAILENNSLKEESKSRTFLLSELWEENDFRKTHENLLDEAAKIGTNALLASELTYSKLSNISQENKKEQSQLIAEMSKINLDLVRGKIEDKDFILKPLPLLEKSDQVSYSEYSLFYQYLFFSLMGGILFSKDENWIELIGDQSIPELIATKDKVEEIAKENLRISQELPFLKREPAVFEHFARLYYAVFLNNAYGQSRADDIKQLLEPIYQEKGNSKRGIFVFLQKEKVYPNNYPHKQDILRLAQVDPRMKDMLLAAGWEVE